MTDVERKRAKRRDRYLRHRERDIAAALVRYYADADAINARNRKHYAENIEIEREKTRDRVRRHRAKRQNATQKSTE